MFEIEKFVEDCRAAMKDTESTKAVREVVAEAVADPAGLIKALGEPTRGTVQKLYQSDDLTIINPIWAPRMTIMPHNHNMWAVIGVYTGREDNIFWRRIEDDPIDGVEGDLGLVRRVLPLRVGADLDIGVRGDGRIQELLQLRLVELGVHRP